VTRRRSGHYSFHAQRVAVKRSEIIEEIHMNWQTPKATDLRFGFEITMYIANR
jgi:coenzyme PQQ precursor peptide PqqA